MKKIAFNREFSVGEEEEHEYEHLVKLTAKLIKRPYFLTHKLVEKMTLAEIRHRYDLCTKHNGDIPSDVYWWHLRKRENNNTPH